MRVMISDSVRPKFFHSTKPQTVTRVSRIQASPPQTSGVFWIQVFFLRRTSRLIAIISIEDYPPYKRKLYHSFENGTAPTSWRKRWNQRLIHSPIFLKSNQLRSK